MLDKRTKVVMGFAGEDSSPVCQRQIAELVERWDLPEYSNPLSKMLVEYRLL